MGSVIRNIILLAIISIVSFLFTIPVSAEDIEETAKYKAPTMDQTLDFIQRMTTGKVDFEPEECILITTAVKNNVTYEYRIPLKEINPGPGHVKQRLSYVDVTVDNYKKKIQRIGRDGKEQWKSKVSIWTENEQSAKMLANALRYLISICGGKTCVGCDPFPWERR
jgi:hypothetical protein